MTEKEKIIQINQFLKEYSDYIDSKTIIGIGISIPSEVIFADRRRIEYTEMRLEEIEKKGTIQESVDSFFRKPALIGHGNFYSYFHAIPYDYRYLYGNPDEKKYYHSCGITRIEDCSHHQTIPVTNFDDFNGLFAPAIEQFKFNQSRKDSFMSLLEDLNHIKSEEPKLYIILGHTTFPFEGYFLMLLEYSDTLYLFRAMDYA